MSAAYNYERFDTYVESGADEREFGASFLAGTERPMASSGC